MIQSPAARFRIYVLASFSSRHSYLLSLGPQTIRQILQHHSLDFEASLVSSPESCKYLAPNIEQTLQRPDELLLPIVQETVLLLLLSHQLQPKTVDKITLPFHKSHFRLGV